MKRKFDRGLWFEPGVKAPEEVKDALCFVFHSGNILLKDNAEQWEPLLLVEWQAVAPAIYTEHYMGDAGRAALYCS